MNHLLVGRPSLEMINEFTFTLLDPKSLTQSGTKTSKNKEILGGAKNN